MRKMISIRLSEKSYVRSRQYQNDGVNLSRLFDLLLANFDTEYRSKKALLKDFQLQEWIKTLKDE